MCVNFDTVVDTETSTPAHVPETPSHTHQGPTHFTSVYRCRKQHPQTLTYTSGVVRPQTYVKDTGLSVPSLWLLETKDCRCRTHYPSHRPLEGGGTVTRTQPETPVSSARLYSWTLRPRRGYSDEDYHDPIPVPTQSDTTRFRRYPTLYRIDHFTTNLPTNT